MADLDVADQHVSIVDFDTPSQKLKISAAGEASILGMGEVQTTPSANTLLARLKDIDTELKLKADLNEKQRVQLMDDHNMQAQFSAFGVLKVAQESVIGDYRFHDLDIIDSQWTKTLTGSGAWTREGDGLVLNSGAAVGKGQFDSIATHYYQAGKGIIVKFSAILSDTGVAGNVREWGYGDNNNGLFFRMDGTTLKIVVRRNGSEVYSVNSANWDVPVTPNQYGHLYYIQFPWLGVGNIFFYYDNALVHTYNFLGSSTTFSIYEPDLPLRIRNENTSNTTNVSLKVGCASVAIEGGTVISGVDEDNVLRQVSVDRRGRLQTTITFPEAPPNTSEINQTAYNSISADADTLYTITNGKTLNILTLSGGGEASTSGSAVELWDDPNGNLTGMSIIEAIFIAASSSNNGTVNFSVVGNGTRRIVMRRKRLDGGTKLVFGRWTGYEE